MTTEGNYYYTTAYVTMKDKDKESSDIIIDSIKKELIAAGYAVMTVLLGDTVCKNCVDTEQEWA